MDPKRKKIYIIVLVVCVLLLVGVLVWSKTGTSEAPVITTQPVVQTPGVVSRTQAPAIKTDGAYPVPQVFPQVRGFDSTVMEDLKLMKSFQPQTLTKEEMGRSNPLSNY